MRNQKFTVAQATLDAAVDYSTEVMLDVSMDFDKKNGYGQVTETVKYYPREVQIYNDCGAELLYNFIANDEELAEYQEDQTQFDLIRVPMNGMIQDEIRVNKVKYIILRKKVSDTVAQDLILDFINYGEL